MEVQKMSARRAHDVLAQMAWERLPEGVGLEIHLITMANILSDPADYRELWRRVYTAERECRG